MTRVAFLTPSLHHGGAERWLLSLARHFHEARAVGCLLLSQHYHPAVLAEARRLMPVTCTRETAGTLRHAREARELLLTIGREAEVLVGWGIPGLRQLCRQVELPVVDVSHAAGAWPAQCRLAAAGSRGADYLAAVSRTAASAYPPGMRSAVQVIYNGVEADRIAPRQGRDALRERLNLAADGRLLLFLGRFSEEKRPQLVLEALQRLPATWQGLLVGHGPMQGWLEEQIGRRTPGRCRLLPPSTAVGDLLAAADCLLLPSRYEGMPLVLLEAWLAGLPTVATRFGFLDEIQRLHGRLSEAVSLEGPSAEELAAAVQRATAARYADHARRTAWRHYTAGAMAQRWEEYLAAVVRHARRAA
jgi:glycosyltransferase involved in cell wall biosynthesis